MNSRLHPSKLLPRLAIRALPLAWVSLAGVALAQDVRVPVQALGSQSVSAAAVIDGVVQAVRQTTVSAQASGRIASLQVKAGDRVRAGQLLAVIDDRETQAGVRRGNAAVAQAQAELHNAQAQFNRTRELQSKGFVSPAALDVAEAQLKGAQAGREQASAAASQAALAQGFTRVNAPFDGWVQQTTSEVGDLAFPGKPLMVIYAPQPLRAVVQVPLSQAAGMTDTGAVEIELPGAKGNWIKPSAVTRVPSADAVAQTVEWRLELPTAAAQALLPGQPLRVRFGTQAQTRLLVPPTAVLQRGELNAVYVAQGTQGFALRAVRLGTDFGAQGVEVLAGLSAGERVALDPVRAGLAQAKPAQ